MDWTERRVSEAKTVLRKWSELAVATDEFKIDNDVVEAIKDDLNTWEAIDRLNELYSIGAADFLSGSAHLLGFDLLSVAQSSWAKPFSYTPPGQNTLYEGQQYEPSVAVVGWGDIDEEHRELSLNVARLWLSLRRNKNWEAADRLRLHAAEVGLELRADRSANGINGATSSILRDLDTLQLKQLLS